MSIRLVLASSLLISLSGCTFDVQGHEDASQGGSAPCATTATSASTSASASSTASSATASSSGSGGSTSSGAPKPPPQAAAAGFTKLDFDDEFDDPSTVGLHDSGATWTQGFSWDPVDATMDQGSFFVQNGELTIRGPFRNITTYQSNHAWRGGYFEARVLMHNWGAFWMMSQNHLGGGGCDPNDPLTWTSEVDVFEGDQAHPNAMFSNLHKNTSDPCGPADEINDGGGADPSGSDTGHAVEGAWTTMGFLWTQDKLEFYSDDVLITTYTPYESTWQPMPLILSAQAGGLFGGPTVDPQETKVDWVRVWQ